MREFDGNDAARRRNARWKLPAFYSRAIFSSDYQGYVSEMGAKQSKGLSRLRKFTKNRVAPVSERAASYTEPTTQSQVSTFPSHDDIPVSRPAWVDEGDMIVEDLDVYGDADEFVYPLAPPYQYTRPRGKPTTVIQPRPALKERRASDYLTDFYDVQAETGPEDVLTLNVPIYDDFTPGAGEMEIRQPFLDLEAHATPQEDSISLTTVTSLDNMSYDSELLSILGEKRPQLTRRARLYPRGRETDEGGLAEEDGISLMTVTSLDNISYDSELLSLLGEKRPQSTRRARLYPRGRETDEGGLAEEDGISLMTVTSLDNISYDSELLSLLGEKRTRKASPPRLCPSKRETDEGGRVDLTASDEEDSISLTTVTSLDNMSYDSELLSILGEIRPHSADEVSLPRLCPHEEEKSDELGEELELTDLELMFEGKDDSEVERLPDYYLFMSLPDVADAQ